MTKNRLKLAVARHALSLALNRPIALATDVTAIKPRYLLRALLRQSSYLPDATARDYFHGYIIERYRKYNPRPSRPSNGPTLTPDRRRSLHKEARKGLLFLQRANDGHPTHLLRALAMAYGRTGRKRRELLKLVVSSSSSNGDPSPMDEEALAQLSELITKNSCDSHIEKPMPARDRLRPSEGRRLGPRMEALIVAQKRQGAPGVPNKIAKIPFIPKTNKWGRSMPRKRVVNMKRRWYAEVLSKILPPLPESDWKTLRDLALGRVQSEGTLRRRTPLAQTRAQDSTNKRNQSANIDQLSSHIGASSILENKETIREHKRKLLGSHPHRITPRYMRRLRGRIFSQCPMMKWDAERRRWVVIWEDLQKSKEVSLGRPERMGMDMFEGVDQAGNVISWVCTR